MGLLVARSLGWLCWSAGLSVDWLVVWLVGEFVISFVRRSLGRSVNPLVSLLIGRSFDPRPLDCL